MTVLASLPVPLLILIFVSATAAVWFAGTQLSEATDVLATRLGIGEEFGGLILLAIATNLPEIAITSSAALSGSLDVAVGNILGGVAIQTAVLAVLDAVGDAPDPLTYRVASLVLVLEGVLVMAMLAVVVMGTQLPASLILDRVTPDALLIVLLWVGGLWLIRRARRGLPWHDQVDTADGQLMGALARPHRARPARRTAHGTGRTAAAFIAAAAVTLIAGVLLERSGSGIATSVGMSGVLFGATVLAAATALPEVSTGLAAVRLGDDRLAVSDIFGGNAFLPVLFLVATLLSGRAVLPRAQDTDIYLTALGALLTAAYVTGLIIRPRRRILRMGVDSLVVLVLYVVGIAGLVVIART